MSRVKTQNWRFAFFSLWNRLFECVSFAKIQSKLCKWWIEFSPKFDRLIISLGWCRRAHGEQREKNWPEQRPWCFVSVYLASLNWHRSIVTRELLRVLSLFVHMPWHKWVAAIAIATGSMTHGEKTTSYSNRCCWERDRDREIGRRTTKSTENFFS